MSGLFRYNSANGSPKPRSTLSPFCTSPGQLQDIIMDNAYVFGNRSPSGPTSGGAGNTSPRQGRSLREHEEQLSNLRKENFNLKLRIYFLEEKTPSAALSAGSESLYKQNVDLKVTTEAMRAELKEKQGLLCEAAAALELMEQTQKKCQDDALATTEQLNQKIQFLEMEIKAMEKFADNDNIQMLNRRLTEMERLVHEYEQQTTCLSAQIRNAEDVIGQKDAVIKDSEQRCSQLAYELAEMREQLHEKDGAVKELEKFRMYAKKVYTDKIDELRSENVVLNMSLAQRINLNNSNLRVVDHRCDNSEEELPMITNQNRIVEERQSTGLRNQIYEQKQQMAEKECQIQELTDSLSECAQAKEKGCKTIQYMMIRIKSLEIDLNRLKGEQANATEGALEEEVKQGYMNQITALQTDLHSAQCDAADAHKWRKECADVCGILTSRLTELAEFLDSLLKQKDMLGVLGQDRRKAMRRAVDKSLDLSKSLNNMSVSGRLSINESSFMQQLHSLSDMLNGTVDEDKENQHNNSITMDLKETSQQLPSGGHNQSTVIETLRAEVLFLKTELERNGTTAGGISVKKERKSFPSPPVTTLTVVEPNSESEAWSEPDRKVSHARIGLDDVSARGVNISRSPKKYNINDTASITSTASELEGSSGATKLCRKNSALKYQERIAEVEMKLSQRDNEILKQQCRLVESENRLKTERLKAIGAGKELNDFKDLNAMLELEISTFKAKIASENSELEAVRSELANKDAAITKLMCERDASAVDLRVATMKLTALQTELADMQRQHSEEIDSIMAQHSDGLENVKRRLMDKHRTELETDWVARAHHEDVCRQLEVTGRRLAETQANVDYMKENEAELAAQIIDGEKSVRTLKKQLDDAALQTSKVVLERTKIMADKLSMEKHNADLQQQLDHTITERSELNGRIGQLEKSNATLQNRLVTSDTTQYQLARSASHGNARYTVLPQMRTAEHSSGGGYTSDELKQRLENSSPDLGIESDAGRTSASEVGRGRGVGRAASQTDLAASMTNIFIEDEEESHIVTENRSSPSRIGASQVHHNCAQVDKENYELKKKLVGTHSAYKNILTQLRASNSRKEQFERDIRREICKTQNVLKNVRTNIESVEPAQCSTDAKLTSRQSS